MSEPRIVVIHYAELGLKGKNRVFFVGMLKRNLHRTLEGCPTREIRSLAARIVIDFGRALTVEEASEVVRRLRSVPGIAHFSLCTEIGGRDIDELERQLVALARRRVGVGTSRVTGELGMEAERRPAGRSGEAGADGRPLRRPEAVEDRPAPRSFCIASHRSDKNYPVTSMAMNRRLGAAVQTATGLPVDIDHADLRLHVEVLNDRFLYYGDRTAGPGGLPVGSSGRVLALLSSGIDSPVAAYRMMIRGCRVFFVHFHSMPYTHRASVDLAEELVRHLAPYQPSARLYFVALAEIQRAIVTGAPAPLRVILYRRMMLRLAAWMAKRTRAKALVTGDSLGQVASQTLENLIAMENASPIPVLRPLIAMGKDEIIAEARRLGTFEISTQPYDDCCSFLMPEHPETRANLDAVLRAEERLGDMSELMREAVNGARVVRVGNVARPGS